jgi:hypothetical protein
MKELCRRITWKHFHRLKVNINNVDGKVIKKKSSDHFSRSMFCAQAPRRKKWSQKVLSTKKFLAGKATENMVPKHLVHFYFSNGKISSKNKI